MKPLAHFILAAGLLSQAALAAQRSVDYDEINNVLDIIVNQAQSPYVLSKFQVEVKDPSIKLTDVKLWLEREGQMFAQGEIATDGSITLPILPKEQAEDVKLVINQEKGAVAISVNMDLAPITSQQVSYRELFVLLEDMNKFVDEMAGGLSWFAPNYEELEFTFGEAAKVHFHDANGNKVEFVTNDEFKTHIPLKAQWMKHNPTIEFSALPEAFAPID
ncbi:MULTISPECIES: DUF2987 domain-containing protein [unclassified Pseudoalteromonas]|uniref:DUF2987 domain-containing protein n=1 Tax=unclassified Pseudoalteromonas TaxID=194690 RepID=UPI0030150AF3